MRNPETYTAENAAKLARLHGQAIEARKLIDRAGILPDWFQSMVLASAFTQAWDPAGAFDFLKQAVEVSKPENQEANRKPGYQAHIHSLMALAEFYYIRGLKNDTEDDWKNARDGYRAARKMLLGDHERQGQDLARQQAASMLVYQAKLELAVVGDDAEAAAVGHIAEAFIQANSIGVEWRRLKTLEDVTSFVGQLQSKALPPRNVVTSAAAELTRRGVKVDDFPASVVALFSVPPDGGLPGAPGQLPSLYAAAA